uniref:Large ribosomal subunit protein uL22c n=1 Tax=Porphyridium sordidum TaxID=28024 RepID=A0A1C9CE38_PORSO|nr:ribosomal protein L22 [Porphyridium sordidum]AOM66661.1 ribosomal protein L22 [Porphyridium sordidum]
MTKINKQESEVKAVRKYVRMSPHKVRRVLDQIRGQDYQKVVMLLEFMPYRACKDILKTVQSAIANAEHNYGINKDNLYITQAYADKGPVMKRFQPRAQGRAYKILKPTCHINIFVGPKS